MKIDTQIREDHQAKLTVEIDADQMEEMKRRAASKIARKVKIPGFRPGKAPYPVIVRTVGEPAVLEEAIELLVETQYSKIIEESQIKPYGPGALEGVPSMDPVTLEFVVPLEAEVTLGEYQSIRKDYELPAVIDDDVEKVIKEAREQQAVIEPVERPAELGDLVTLKISAERQNEEDEAKKTFIQERSTQLIVRGEADASDEEWPYEGFSQNLVGLSAGDTRDITFTYPEDSRLEELRGVTAEYHVTVENVKKRTLPEIDDELARSLGDFEDLESLRKNVRESLEQQRMQEYNEEYDNEIVKQAVGMSAFKYPPQMLEREIDTVLDDLAHRMSHQGMDMDLYLKIRGMDMAALRDEIKPVAEARIRRALFFVEFGKSEKIEIKPEELEKQAISTMNYLYGTLDEKDQKKLMNRDVQNNIIGNVLADMLSQRSLEKFRNLARGIVEEENTETAAPEAIFTDSEPAAEENTTLASEEVQQETE